MQITGKFQANSRGFGFILDDENGDVFIPERDTLGAMDGDTVLANVFRSDGRRDKREGEIVQVVERVHQRIVGTFQPLAKGGYVSPDALKIREDVKIEAENTMGAKAGQKVVVALTRWPDGNRSAAGNIIVVLGAVADPGVDILSVLYQNDIPTSFPDDVLAAADAFPETPQKSDFEGRRDLGSLQMVTIDGEDARDLDDAVSLEMLTNGNYQLGVHIADVSHYVKEGSVLDEEAYKRATSVYLPDRVIPMLPQALSNGLCSLTANTPRLAFSILMEVDAAGVVVHHDIFESVLHIDERMTYTAVKELLENDNSPLQERYKPLLPMFKNMEKLAEVLRAHRKQRGSIDFSFDESKIVVDGEGHPIEIKRASPNVATRLIEEFMLVCNEVVSGHYFHTKTPFVYRVHEDPDIEKMVALRLFLAQFGYQMPAKGTVHPADMQKILEQIKGKPEEKTISTMMLRSLQKARYTNEHIWHFGLAAPYYSHFTSPIRRYPDLLIHRIMKEELKKALDDKRKAHYTKVLPEMTRHCSERERAADSTERECVDMKKAEYMQAHIGETFVGTVSGVTSFGLFIELENSVEGLVRIAALYDDEYSFDDKTLTLNGAYKGKTWRIGDTMTIIVARSSPEARQIDFAPEGTRSEDLERMKVGRNDRKAQTHGSFSRNEGRNKGGKPRGQGGARKKSGDRFTGTAGKSSTGAQKTADGKPKPKANNSGDRFTGTAGKSSTGAQKTVDGKPKPKANNSGDRLTETTGKSSSGAQKTADGKPKPKANNSSGGTFKGKVQSGGKKRKNK